MMKKLLTLLCLVNSLCQINAQWELVSGTNGKQSIHNYGFQSNYKSQRLLYNEYGVFYKKYPNSKVWTKMSLGSDTCDYDLDLKIGEEGIFRVKRDIASCTIFSTSNFGKKWNGYSLNMDLSNTRGFVFNFIFTDTAKYFCCSYTNSFVNGIDKTRIFRSKKGSNEWMEIASMNIYASEGISGNKNRIILKTLDTIFLYKNFNFINKITIPLDSVVKSKINRTYLSDSAIIISDDNGNPRTVYISNNDGVNWRKVADVSNSIRKISKIAITDSLIFLNTDNIYQISKNNGKTWDIVNLNSDFKKVLLNPNITFQDLTDSSFQVFYYSGSYNVLAGYVLGTYNFKRQTWQLEDIHDFPVFNVKNRLFSNESYSDDNAKTWIPMDKADFYSLEGSIVKDTLIYAISNEDTMILSQDLGKTWIKQPLFPVSYGQKYVKGDTIVVHSVNSYWISYKYPYTTWTKVIDAESGYNVFLNNGILYYTEFGRYGIKRCLINGTKLSTLIETVSDIRSYYVDDDKILFYDNMKNKLKISKDFGLNWKDYSVTKSDSSYFDFSLFQKVDKDVYVMSTSQLAILDNKVLGSIDVGIFISTNGGESWSKINDGLTYDCSRVYFTSYLTISKNKLYFSTEKGRTVWVRDLDNLTVRKNFGNVFSDKNKNGKRDNNELPLSNIKILSKNSGISSLSDKDGNYIFFYDTQNSDSLSLQLDNKYAIVTTPRIVSTKENQDTTKDFGVFLSDNINDVKINVTAITPIRPGFNNTYLLNYKNLGSTTATGKITFSYNAKQSFVEASTNLSSNTAQILTWDYANLQPNESRTIQVTFKTAVDIPIRTQVTHVITIDPLSIDTFKSDNVDSLFLNVVGSFDPNDKQVSLNNNKTAPTVIDANTELTYTIRFQNTGNYPADFVKVTDTLSDKLDLASLKVIASSHNYSMTFKNKNVLVFDFNPIILPDSTANEKESHGFIKFSIKPKKALIKDEVIKNTAYIYFDYNPAIITNTVETGNQKPNNLLTPSVFEAISVYPNPTTGILTFKLDKFQGKELSINIYSIDGKLMLNKHLIAQPENQLNGEFLQNGLYILQLKTGDEMFMGKFMIQK
jgi:uncharacterized repeat protein (TIGR01451 family)